MDNSPAPTASEAELSGRQKTIREYALSDAFSAAGLSAARYWIGHQGNETAVVSTDRAEASGRTTTFFRGEDLPVMQRMLSAVKAESPEVSSVTIEESGHAKLWTRKALADFQQAAAAKTQEIETYDAMPWYKKLVKRDPRKPESVGGP